MVGQRRIGLTALLILISFGIVGCVTPGEGDRQLQDQNWQAGTLIEKDPTAAPATRQAGADVRQNSEVLLQTLGAPKSPVPYTPENSAALRKKAIDEHSSWPGWGWIIGGLGLAATVAGRFFGIGWLPVVGDLISSVSSKWGNGAGANEKVAAGLQEGIEVAHGYLESRKEEAVKKLMEHGLTAEQASALIAGGDDMLAEIRRKLADRGLTRANTKLFESNPAIAQA
jgi:hypothetical protein